MQKVRDRFGDDARVIRSRNVTVRDGAGLGQSKLVEILVETTEQPRRPGAPSPAVATRTDVDGIMAREVARIERLVESLAEKQRRPQRLDSDLSRYPLARLLLGVGASNESVRRLAGAYRSELSDGVPGLPSAIAHLQRYLSPAGGDWDGFGGCHVFLGDCGAGKSDMVLGTAARLQASGKKTLVLSLLPRHGGEVRRLQLEAADQGFDAAIIRRPEQFITCTPHLSRYDAVLVDTPGLFGSELAGEQELQEYLSRNEALHRHCVVPLDLDLREGGELWEAARLWNCDWLSLSRLDRCRRPGKIVDLVGRIPLPLSLCGMGPWPGAQAEIADAETLTNLLVGGREVIEAAAAKA